MQRPHRTIMLAPMLCLLLGGGACEKPDGGAESDGSTTGASENDEDVDGEDDSADGADSSIPSLGSFESGDDGGEGTEDPDGDITENCGEIKIESDPLAPNIMLVIDRSGSMAAQYWNDNGTSRTRWYSLHGIVTELLNRLGGTVNFGMKYFPADGQTNDEGCKVDDGVHVPVGPNAADAIISKIPASEAYFEGETPTNSGLKDAVEYMKSLEDSNQEAIILVVDGETTCGQRNEHVAKTAADAFAHEIPVYVVGVDLKLMNDSVASLEDVAVMGGTGKIYNSTDANQLAMALETLIGDVGSCKIPLKPAPKFSDYVEVVIDGETIPWLEGEHTCTGKDGWVYTGDTDPHQELELCGAPCDTFLRIAKADITYECPPPP